MFQDRKEAGLRLAEKLIKYRGSKDTIVVALPRGGVVVGAEIAQKIDAPLDVIITRKIGFPGEPEFAIGAISENGKILLNDKIIERYNISKVYIDEEISKQKAEIERRILSFRNGKPLPSMKDKIIILVDDGVATGFTMISAIKALREEGIKKLVVAIPLSSNDAFQKLKTASDEIICLEIPEYFLAIGNFYIEFEQLTDEDVKELMRNVKLKRKTSDEKSFNN